ncbi:MAG: twin-arginine translocation signal domain-containing protein, partial [Planctomycetota bacterium]|nr:twin-arginine translocation signal domain-containing protein [Planctomycetota bacterium]
MSDLAPTNSPTPATPASTRRDFLAKAAAVAGTTALGAFASAAKRTADLPQDRARGSIPTDRPIRMGIIGTGGMGGGHINAVISLTEKGRTDARIVAVSDVCKPRLDNARKV